MSEDPIFARSVPGRRGFRLADPFQEVEPELPEAMRRDRLELPEVSEADVVRHYTLLAEENYGVDNGPYPLGSCTMKYNPRVVLAAANRPGFRALHPYQQEADVQGALSLLAGLESFLGALSGMDRVTLQPAAGAQGELTGLLMVRAYHLWRGEGERRRVLVPDSAHGTNPASASLTGMEAVQVDSNARGRLDLGRLKELADGRTAALMLTNPNTLGLWEDGMEEAAEIVHRAGGLFYLDGANLNALLGRTRVGELGCDLMHFNLHKTFGAPHGGGGPGAGPVGVKQFLEPFLPLPVLARGADEFTWDYERPLSIGRVKAFYGNFGVAVMAYAYLRALGKEGLLRVSEHAVLNANYLAALLTEEYRFPYPGPYMHEFVARPGDWLPKGLHTLDIAKRLMDYGFHPPTIYFPLLVEEALMLEPTETESKGELESLAGALLAIARECREEPEKVAGAPHRKPVGRLDEVQAARRPRLRWGAK